MSRQKITALILVSSAVSLIAYLVVHRHQIGMIARWLRGAQ